MNPLSKWVIIISFLLLFLPINIKAQFAGGSGTEEDPYQITTIQQLQEVSNYTDKHFIQVSDIDASDTENWNEGTGFKPIGDGVLHFSGSFNGQDYSINDLFINGSEDYASLFGYSENASIINIHIDGLFLSSGSDRIGALVGYAENSIIQKCLLENIEVINGNFSAIYSGGVIGYMRKGRLKECTINTKVSAPGRNVGGVLGYNDEGELKNIIADVLVSGGWQNTGGLAGQNDGIIYSAMVSGEVEGDDYVGGIIGSNLGTGPSEIRNSTFSGKVTGVDYVGGLNGQSGFIFNSISKSDVIGEKFVGGITGNTAVIDSSESHGTVYGNSAVGGLVGRSNRLVSNSFSTAKVEGSIYVGGLIGLNMYLTVETSYSTGSVKGEQFVGGLIGRNTQGEIYNTYSLSTVTGIENVGGLVGATEEGLISNSYSVGKIAGSTDVGGLVGTNGGTIEGSYWDVQLSNQLSGVGRGTSSNVIGLSTLEMFGTSAEEYMPEFAFKEIWASIPDDYPKLLWSIPYYNVENIEYNSAISSGQLLAINVSIKNIGGLTDTSNVVLKDSLDNVVDSVESVILESGEETHLTFEWQSEDSDEGIFNFTIETLYDRDTLSVEILQIPATVVLNTPEHQAQNVDLLPEFTWNEASLAESYQIQIGDDNTFETKILNVGNLNILSYQLSDSLDYLSTYYWRVRGSAETGDGEWSDVNSFTTIIEKPLAAIPALPANKATDISISTDLNWAESDRAETYEVQLSKTDDFSTLVADSSGIETLTFSSEMLSFNTTYYWRVKAHNVGGESEWSEAWSFFTEFALKTPVVELPESEKVDVPIPTRFEWNPMEGALNYELQISTDEEFATVLKINEGGQVQVTTSSAKIADQSSWKISKIIENLDFETKYFWRVKAINDDGVSDWSTVREFITEKAPVEGRVALSSPSNNVEEVEYPIMLQWNEFDEADTYEIEISKSVAFDTTISVREFEETSYAIDELPDTTAHFWKVRATVNGQLTAWSEVWEFTTELRTPEIPMWQPEKGEQDVSTTPLIAWSESSRSDYFDLQLADNPEFNNPTVDLQELSTTEYQVANELEDGVTYNWRVRAGNESGYSDWSAPLSFTTQLSTSIEKSESPQAVSLQQNYPNPFNPTTIIQFGMPEAGFVELGVYNMLGQRVALLANEQRSKGWHEVTLDASNLSSGTYIYRLQIGRDVLTRKLMLIK